MIETDAPAAPDPKVAAIRALSEAGYCLIPLKGKRPVPTNWPDTPPGRYTEQHLVPLPSYGVVLKPGDLVIDVDPRNFAPGDAPIKRLLQDMGVKSLPPTFTVRTGGDGYHLYLRKPPDLVVVNDVKDGDRKRIYPGVEFKSVGRQVVGPGSIHPDTGKTYMVVSAFGPDRVAQAPASLLKIIERPTESAQVNVGAEKDGAGTRDDPETQGRYVAYLQDVALPSTQGQGGDANAFLVAAHGRDLGLPARTTHELMLECWNDRCEPPWSPRELRTKVLNAYHYSASKVPGSSHPAADFKVLPQPPVYEQPLKWVTDKNGKPIKCFYNLLNYLGHPDLNLGGVFGYNEFTAQVEILRPAPWNRRPQPVHASVAVQDRDLKLIKGYLATKHGYEAQVSTIEEAISNVADYRRFHPVRDYLQGLRWDGKLRLDTWLRDYAGAADTPYVRACARKVLCAAAMRAVNPGCKFDHVLVLEGEQGVGKSGICKILGGPWYGDFSIDPHNKDTVQLMQGKWITEIAELEFSRRSEADAIKAFLTREIDKVRLPYGRLAGEFPRQSIFIATKNPGPDGTYLQDETGNRRWWPVLVTQVDFKGLTEVRDQLFAEAVARLKRSGGEKLYMDTKELKREAEEAAGLRHADHPWVDCVAEWIAAMGEDPPVFLTGRHIFIHALGGGDREFDRRAALGVAKTMRALGWWPHLQRRGALVVRGYAPRVASANGSSTEQKALDKQVAELL